MMISVVFLVLIRVSKTFNVYIARKLSNPSFSFFFFLKKNICREKKNKTKIDYFFFKKKSGQGYEIIKKTKKKLIEYIGRFRWIIS